MCQTLYHDGLSQNHIPQPYSSGMLGVKVNQNDHPMVMGIQNGCSVNDKEEG